jgi:hypothetical protein
MNRAAQFAFCFCMLATPAQGQQIASVALPQVSVPATPAGKQAQPNSCEKLEPLAIGDGFVEPPDQEPRAIVVEMVEVSDKTPHKGGVVQGDVRVRNSGVHPIQIPWSDDPSVRGKVHNPQDLKSGKAPVDWGEGYLHVYLQGSGELKILSQGLYSSKSASGSTITIGPGEWVTVKITFNLEPEYPIADELKTGDGRLTVGWEQTDISGTIYGNGCLVGSGYFHYDHYYKQQNPSITIKVN